MHESEEEREELAGPPRVELQLRQGQNIYEVDWPRHIRHVQDGKKHGGRSTTQMKNGHKAFKPGKADSMKEATFAFPETSNHIG